MPADSKKAQESRNFDLLMHVPLKLTAELGNCTMSVAEVLRLGAGSVVQLDRVAGGPIDLRVNDRAIARGEIVAVDDNFGLRITELLAAPG